MSNQSQTPSEELRDLLYHLKLIAIGVGCEFIPLSTYENHEDHEVKHFQACNQLFVLTLFKTGDFCIATDNLSPTDSFDFFAEDLRYLTYGN